MGVVAKWSLEVLTPCLKKYITVKKELGKRIDSYLACVVLPSVWSCKHQLLEALPYSDGQRQSAFFKY
jgi:hypothetical protein